MQDDTINQTNQQEAELDADEKELEQTLSGMSNEEMIDMFIDGMIEEKTGGDISDEMRKASFADLRDRLYEEINRSILAELSDEKLDELSKSAADGKMDGDMIAQAAEDEKLDVGEITLGTMAKFRELFLGDKAESEE